MSYSFTELSKIKSKVFAKISAELELANKNDEMDLFLDKYGIIIEEDAMYVDTRTMKILVFGALAGHLKDYQLTAKKMGISLNNIVFEEDYSKLQRYDVSRLENSFEYSDIVFGPVPHKQVGIGDNSSFLASIEKEPNKYPRVVKAVANNQLKLSISSFKDALLRTRYFETLNFN